MMSKDKGYSESWDDVLNRMWERVNLSVSRKTAGMMTRSKKDNETWDDVLIRQWRIADDIEEVMRTKPNIYEGAVDQLEAIEEIVMGELCFRADFDLPPEHRTMPR